MSSNRGSSLVVLVEVARLGNVVLVLQVGPMAPTLGLGHLKGHGGSEVPCRFARWPLPRPGAFGLLGLSCAWLAGLPACRLGLAAALCAVTLHHSALAVPGPLISLSDFSFWPRRRVFFRPVGEG